METEVCPKCQGYGILYALTKDVQLCYLCNGSKVVDWITYMKYKGSNNGRT